MTMRATALALAAAAVALPPQPTSCLINNYTTTAIDPSDDCTVWYVGDYLTKDAANYSTKIGAFRMPGCGR